MHFATRNLGYSNGSPHKWNIIILGNCTEITGIPDQKIGKKKEKKNHACNTEEDYVALTESSSKREILQVSDNLLPAAGPFSSVWANHDLFQLEWFLDIYASHPKGHS